jgi:uncharacterized protein DUF1565
MSSRCGACSLLVLVVAACGGSNNAAPDAGDAGPGSDAAPPRTDTVSVMPGGNDAADGVAAAVKTIARAFAIAKGNGAIRVIKVAAGRYSAANGDIYPLIVPANVTVEGPTGGGAVLAGDRSGPGLALEDGTLANLTFEDFSVALTVTRTGKLSAVRIRSSGVAIHAQGSASLAVSDLTLTGAAGACATGIQAVEVAHVEVTGLVSQTLGSHLEAKDQAEVKVTGAQVTGDLTCTQPLFTASTGKSFKIANSTFDGGGTAIASSGATTLTDTTIKNAGSGLNVTGAVLTMTGGMLSGNIVGARVDLGKLELQRVAVTGNSLGVDAGGNLDVSNSTVTDNDTGIRCRGFSCGIFATTIRNRFIGLDVPGGNVAVILGAQANTWLPDTQGADADGHYTTMQIQGPVSGANFSLGSFVTLNL